MGQAKLSAPGRFGLCALPAAVFVFSANPPVRESVELIENIRRRYDGERRNPWDEAECGHHYARAMSSWSAVMALGGFQYHAAEKSL